MPEETISEIASKGGKARARKLSAEDRSKIARNAVAVRWEKAGKEPVAKATHGTPERPLRIGDIEIPCFVLEDERRVLVQRETIKALGMSMGGSSYKGGDRLARFASQDRLKSFAKPNLASGTLQPIRFITTRGNLATGYEATILPDICDAVLDARKANRLTKKQMHVADRCEILMRGLARVGIIALVDEATGYQADRARDALSRILEAFVAKELQKWVRTFEPDYYQEIYRLKGWDYPETKGQRPRVLGTITNDLVYKRLAPGVLEELRKLNPPDDRGRRKHKHFQRLTPDLGHPKLKQHLAVVTGYMRVADTWDTFMKMMNRGLPRQIPMPLFDLPTEIAEANE